MAAVEAAPAAAAAAAPPEGVDGSNRWAELENAFVAVEAERDSLKQDLVQLRKEKVEKAIEVLSPKETPAIDRKELDELKVRLSTAVEQAEARLKDVVEERNRSAKLSEDLEAKTASLANLSKDKLQFQYELNLAKSSLLPVQQDRDRFQEAAQEAERQREELREEVAKASEEKNRMFREKQELKRELTSQVEDAQNHAKFHETVAEEAREKQEAARKEVADALRRLSEQAQDSAEERAILEKKLALRGEQLERANALRDTGVTQLQETKEALEAAQASEKDAVGVADKHKVQLAELEEQLAELRREHEELLRRRIPGAADLTVPPEGFGSITELVRELTAARTDLLQAKQEKEQYQDTLLEVEREIRARYPALERQRTEYERLRVVAAQLTKQNEGLLKQVQQLERGQRDADGQAKQAKRSVQILEEHAKEMANQLGVLVVKNQRLSGKTPTRPPGVTDLESLESDRKYWHSVQDLAAQNEHLKKSVRRLAEECETEAQKELTVERQAHEDLAKQMEDHLAEKATHMKAVMAAMERLTHERDGAQRALRERPAEPVAVSEAPAAAATPPAAASGSSGGKASGPLTARGDLVPREHLTIVREEFAKNSEVLRNEAREVRASEQKAREELAKALAKLDCELATAKNYESSRSQLDKRLEERKARCEELERRNTDLERNLEKELEGARNAEATIGQAKRDKGNLDSQLKLERSNVARLEHSNATLVAEKAAHTQRNVDLQTRMTQQAEAYNGMKVDLEAAYKRAEEHLKEQLEHSKQRESELDKTVKDVSDARSEREAEAADARKRVLELETNITRLETQVAERTFELDELRAALPTRPRRGTDVAAEAEEQLRKAQTPQPKAEDVAKLEQKVRFAEEREKRHAEDKKLWESLIATNEKDLKTEKERASGLEGELTLLKELQAKHDETTDKTRQKEQDLETKVFELDKQAKELQALVEKKDSEVASAKLDGDAKVSEARTQLESIEHKTADARDNLEDWQRKHREAVQAHSKDIDELNTVKEKTKLYEVELKELRQKSSDLEVDSQQARKQQANEVEMLKKRSEDAEKHAEALGVESRRYQEKLLAFAEQTTGGPNVDMERVAQEMRRARELGELQRQELEIDKQRAERQVKTLQEEVGELHKRLDKEQDTALQLQAEVKRQQRGLDKLERLGLAEDENRRLAEEAKSVQGRLDEANKELATQKQQLEPLQLCKAGVARREEDWERTKKEMEAKADEWKELYDEVVQRFDSLDVKELKTLREDQVKWNATKLDLDTRLKNTTEALEKATANKQSNEALQKSLAEATTKVGQLSNARSQLAASSEKHLAEATKQTGLRDLGLKKIADLEASLKKSSDEVTQSKEKETKSLTDRAALQQRMDKLVQDMKKNSEEVAQGQAIKTQLEELQKKLAEKDSDLKNITRLRAQAIESVKTKDASIKQAEALKQLGTRRIEALEAELAKTKEEGGKAATAETQAALKKAEDDLISVRQQADRAISLAMDYQRGCGALIAKNNTTMNRNQVLEELETRAASERAAAAATAAAAAAAVAAASVVAPAPVAAPVAVAEEAAIAAEPAAEAGEAAVSSGSTAGIASNPFSAGSATASVLFPGASAAAAQPASSSATDAPTAQAAAKRKLEEASPAAGGATAEAGPAKTAKVTPAAAAAVSPPSTPIPKKAPRAAVAVTPAETPLAAVAPAAAPAAIAGEAAAAAAAAVDLVDLDDDAAMEAPAKDQA